MQPGELSGQRILIVEDEFVVSMELEFALRAEGAEVLGPVASVPSALVEIETGQLDAAVIDINLRGELAYPVAEALRSRHIPFVFTTAYSEAEIKPPFQDVTYLGKPVSMLKIADALAKLTSARKPTPRHL
jgi:CheY-like chemotaxis protein